MRLKTLTFFGMASYLLEHGAKDVVNLVSEHLKNISLYVAKPLTNTPNAHFSVQKLLQKFVQIY